MFRIKTDIRQYRCKNREKVERLIRNWVIRPSDLILDGESKEWRPIGTDPLFLELFASLDEAHHNQPDTVITTRSTAAEGEVEQEEEAPPVGEASPNGQTPGFGILRRPGRRRPPEPSPDVEGVIRDSDEITVMTEKTFERLQEEAEAPTPDEVTEISARPTFDDEEATPEEVTNVIDRSDLPDEEEAESDRGADYEPKVVISDQAEEAPSTGQKLVIGPGTGRYNLPEDVFATAEIPETRREDVFAEGPPGMEEDSRSRWNIVLDEMPEEEAEEKDEVDALRDTDDIDRTDLFQRDRVPKDSEALGEDSEDLRATVDLSAQDLARAPETDESRDADTELRDTLDLEEEDRGAAAQDETAQLVVAEAVGDGFEVDEEALDEALVELEAVAIEVQTAEEDLPEIDFSAVKPAQDVTMVSAGYTMAFPIEIVPSEETLEAGLIRSQLPEAKRDRYLNQPEPKTIGHIVTHSFDLQWRTNQPEPLTGRLPLPLIAVASLGALLLIVLLFWLF